MAKPGDTPVNGGDPAESSTCDATEDAKLPEKFTPQDKAQLYLAGLDRSAGSTAEYDFDFYGGTLVGTSRLTLSDRYPVELFVEATSVDEGVNIRISGMARLHGSCERCLEPFDDTLEVDLNRIYYYEAAYRKLEQEIAIPESLEEDGIGGFRDSFDDGFGGGVPADLDVDYVPTYSAELEAERFPDAPDYGENVVSFRLPMSPWKATWEEEDLSATLDEAYILDDKNWQIDLFPMMVDAIVPQIPIKVLCSEGCPGLCVECGRRLADLPEDHTHAGQDARMSGLWAWADELSQYRDRLEREAKEQSKGK